MSAKYTIIFLLTTTAALLVAARSELGVVRLASACAGVSFALLAVAYAGGGPRLLLKRPDGRRRAWAWAVQWPYFLMNGLAFHLYRLTGRRPPFDLVAPNLFLGRRLTAREARRPGIPDWSAVLDLAAEFPEIRSLRTARD